MPTLDPDATRDALAIRDLTDPALGHHAVQDVVTLVEQALARRWAVYLWRHRANPVVPVADNYDRLRYGSEVAVRDGRYTRELGGGLMLRSHTTAHVPPLLRAVASAGAHDVLLACPGIVYRRDAIDRRHAGEPHQLELWRVRRDGPALTEDDLEVMITTAVLAVLPDREWRTTPATHPYTLAGRQLDVRDGDDWLEVGECGLAHPEVLAAAGLPSTASGLAMGLGLDRLVMLRKGIDDIRLLRADDPRVAVQLGDLRPYRPVSNRPPVVRDLSLAVDGDADAELLGDQVRAALGADADAVEEVTVVDETPLGELPPAAIARLGIGPGQKNVLLRIVLRHPARTLRKEEANAVRDRVAAALHRGVPTAYRDDPGVATAPWQTPTPERTTTAGSTSSSPTTTPSSSRA